jgi:hypothetical protein
MKEMSFLRATARASMKKSPALLKKGKPEKIAR